MKDNIIFFPRHRTGDRPPQNVEELRELITIQKMEMIDDIIDDLLPSILSSLYSYGFNLDNDYDIGFVIESLRSAMQRSVGVENPIQAIADQLVIVVNERGERVHANGAIHTT